MVRFFSEKQAIQMKVTYLTKTCFPSDQNMVSKGRNRNLTFDLLPL